MPRSTNRKLFAAERAMMKSDGIGGIPTASRPNREFLEILEAIEGLKEEVRKRAEQAPATPDDMPEMSVLRGQLHELRDSIDKTKREIASVRHPDVPNDRLTIATLELDAIVQTTEEATNTILNATEEIDERVLKLRQAGADPETIAVFDEINGMTLNILEACGFQDLSGQRINKVIQTIRYLEDRIGTMIEIWGAEEFVGLEPVDEAPQDADAELLQGPQLKGEGVSQDDVDALFD